MLFNREKRIVRKVALFLLQVPLHLLLNIEISESSSDSAIGNLNKYLQDTSHLRYTFPFVLVEECCCSKLLFAEEFQHAVASKLLLSASLLHQQRDEKTTIDSLLNRLSILKSILLNGKQENVPPTTPSSAFVFLFFSCEIMISDLYVKFYSIEKSFQFKPNCQSISIGPMEISIYSLNASSWQEIPRPLSGTSILKFTSAQVQRNAFKMHPLICFVLRTFPDIFEQKINLGMYLEWSLLIGTIDLCVLDQVFFEIPLLSAIVFLIANQENLVTVNDSNTISFSRIDIFGFLAPKYFIDMGPTDLEEITNCIAYWNHVSQTNLS